MGILQHRISEWENERILPDPLTLEKLASALDCSIDFFFKRTDQIRVNDLSDEEYALILDWRRGNKNALDDAMLTKMNRPASD